MTHHQKSKRFSTKIFVALLSASIAVSAISLKANEEEALDELPQEVLTQRADALTKLLRTARITVSANQALIDDPVNSGVTTGDFMSSVRSNFQSEHGDLNEGDEYVSTLLTAITEVMESAVSGQYADEWKGHKPEFQYYENKFLPARFAIKVGEKFTELQNNAASLKLTAPDHFLSIIRDGDENKPAKMDDWERTQVDAKFLNGKWPKDLPFSEIVSGDSGNHFRYVLPEYYTESCVACHSNGEGAKIHLSKKDGNLGDLGGAISITFTEGIPNLDW